MLALNALQSLMAFVFCLICVLLILLILVQKGRGGGLSGAFGGVGSYSPFGTKTGDALTWATVVLTGLFLLIAVLSNYVYKPQKLTGLGAQPTATQPSTAGLGDTQEGPALPVLPATPAPSAPAAPAPSAPAAPESPAGTGADALAPLGNPAAPASQP